MPENFVKKYRATVTAIAAPVLIFTVAFTLLSCSPQDIKYDEAIRIAKNDFGCEKILWISSRASILSDEPWDALKEKIGGSHYEYFVVGEKNGEEIYIIIPSPQDMDPFVTTWALEHSFTQIVDKFNENGANYVADVPNDYYSHQFDYYIDLKTGIGLNGADDEFLNRLDVQAVFEYTWETDGVRYRCTVTQENGELRAYKETIDI